MSNPILTLDRDEVESFLVQAYDGGLRTAVDLYGPPGTGKTTLVHNVARRLGLPVYVHGGNPVTSTADVMLGVGPDMTGRQPLALNYGPGMAAWGHHPAGLKPGIILIDDVHLVGDDGQALLYKLCDTGVGASHMLPDGRVLQPHPDAWCFLTQNGELELLHEAVLDRVLRLKVSTPSTEMLARLRPEIRELCAADYDGTSNPVATYREWLHTSELWGMVGLAKALVIAKGDAKSAEAMLRAMATIGIQDAVDATMQIAALMLSGNPAS